MFGMIQRKGSFRCGICEERIHSSKKNEEYRSYFPERRILVCDYCLHEYHTDPEYEHLRPDITPEEKAEIEERREYNGKRTYL